MDVSAATAPECAGHGAPPLRRAYRPTRLPGLDTRPVLLWTAADGGYKAVDASTLKSFFAGKACVELNGCKCQIFGYRREPSLAKGLVESCVCWATLVATMPACLFACTFWQAFATESKPVT